jgi:hypothetical protein
MIDEKRFKSNNDQQKSFKKMNTNAKLNIKKRMTLRRVIDLRFVDNSDFDSIIVNDEKKIIYVVIIVETSRKKKRALRENINVIFRKAVFEYFINVKTTRARKLRNQRLNDLEQDFITRANVTMKSR